MKISTLLFETPSRAHSITSLTLRVSYDTRAPPIHSMKNQKMHFPTLQRESTKEEAISDPLISI